MANGGRIDFTVGFKSDTQGLQQIKTELNELRKITPTMLKEINPTWDMSKARSEFMKVEKTINEVSQAFDNAFNPQLGVTNIQKLNSSLQKIGIDKIYNQFSSLGTAGTQAFQKLASQALTTNIRLKESSTILDKIGNTLMNTIKWNISSSVVNGFANSIQQAWGYVKHLDSSLNDIRIVTGKSADEMDRFAEKANKAAKRLGSSTTDYTEASLIYYQQGLSDKETAARAETTIKAANVTGQSGEAVSEQLTAVWNGYKVSAEEAELYIDKLAAVAATTASDLEELSTGMSKVASAAAIMGVDIDQLNAQLATIVSVTREAPESIGTALKTVYARMSDITAGLDGEVSLDEYTQQMEAMGIHVLDANGNLRDMGDVIEEIGGKWQTMTREQQTSLAQTIAGTRQYSRMMALFDNWGMYTKALETSATAAGTLNEQNEIYLESTEAHLQQLKTSVEGVYDSLIDTEGMNDLIDGFTNIVTLFNHFLDGAGGAKTALMLLGTVGVKAFAKPMQNGLVRLITNFKIAKDNAAQLKAEMELTQALSNSKAMENPLVKQMVEAKQAVQQYYGVMSQADLEQSNALINQLSQAQALEAQWKKDADAYNAYAQQIVNATVKQGNVTGVTKSTSQDFDKFDIAKDKNSQVNTEVLQKSGENVNNILNSTNDKLKDIKKLTIEWNKAQAGVNQNGKTSEELFQDIKTQASAVKNEVLKNAEVFDALGVDVTKVSTLLKKVKIGDPQSIVNFRKELEALVQEAQKTKQQMENIGTSAKTGLSGAQLAVQQAKAAFDNFLNTQSIKNFSRGLTDTISSIGQLGMGFTSLANLPKIFDNENLSTGEKFAQILSSLSMGVISFTKGLSGLIKGIKLITQSIPLATIALKTLNAEQQLALATRLTGNTVTDATIAKNTIETATTWELIKAKAALNAENLIALAIAAALLVATFAITAAVNAEKKAREEEAAVAENRSKIAQENLNKANEEKNKIDELATSYERLREQERNGEISKADMAKQTAELVDQYGDENAQLIEMTGNYEKLEEAIRSAQAAANEDAISSAQFAQTAAGDKAAGEMWRDMSGAQRDVVYGERAIDLGKEKDVDEIANILEEFYIDRLGTGHINFEDLTEAIQTDAQGLVTALEENGSSTATELLSILRATEGLDEAIAAQTSEIGAKIDQIILDEPIEEGSITTVEEFNNAVDSYTDKFIAAGKTEKEAYQMAYDYVSGIDETTQLIGNLNKSLNPEEWDTAKDIPRGALNKSVQAYQDNVTADSVNGYEKNFIPGWLFDNQEFTLDDSNIVNTTFRPLVNELKTEVNTILEKNENMTPAEALNYVLSDSDLVERFAQHGGGEAYLKYIQSIAENSLFNGESFEDIQSIAKDLYTADIEGKNAAEEVYQPQQDEFDYTQLRNDIIDAYIESNPDQAPFLTLIENLPQKLYKQGYDTVEEAQGFIDQEIFNAKLENFDNSASNLIAGLQPLVENARYITPEVLAQDAGWQEISKYEDVLRVKGFGDEFDTVQDESATEEERTAALQEIIGYLASISEVQDGLYTKEKAAEEGLTETTLTEQRNRGEISQEQYQQKFQGAMDYELEELGIDQEEFDAYTEAVEDLTEQYELSDEMVQRIAKDNLKLQKTVDTLASDWKEYGDVLKSGDKTNIKYAQGIGKIKESVEDMFGTEVSDKFIQEHLEEIQQLAEGDLTVFDELSKAAAEDIIVDIAAVTDASQLTGEFATLNEAIQNAELEDLEIGASLDTAGFTDALNALLLSSEMTIDEVESILESLGFEPEVTYKEVPIGDFQAQHGEAVQEVLGLDGNVRQVKLSNNIYTVQDGMVKIPIINGSTTKFSGSPKSTLKAPKPSGGGGGGSKPKEPDKKDPIDDQIDRYHDINVEIQRLSTAYDRLQKAQEKLSGADLIKNLNEQLKVLEKQKDAYAAKIELARQEQAELQNSLGAGGVTFAEDGTISNYAAALQKQENQVNAIIANYNNMTAEEQEAYKEVVEKAQEDYEKFKEEIARYDELVNSEIPEMEDAIQEFIDQQVEIQVQKFNMSVEIELDLAEAERQWNEFKKTVIDGINEDDILGNAGAALNNLNVYSDPTTGEGTVSATSGHVNDILNELALMDAGQESSIYGTDRAKAIEDLKTYSDTLMEEMMNFEGEVEEIRQMYLDLIDETNEEIDKQIENYEFVTNLIEHDLNLIEKIKGEDAYAEMATYYEKQAENYKSQLEFQRQEVNLWKERMDAAKSAGNEDAYEKFKENWMEAVEQLNSTTDAALDNLMSKYENAINKIFDDLNNKVTNGMGLDYVAEEWELSNQAAERYLDTVNEAFAIDSLRNKYQTAIDESSSLTTQQKLNDLMKEEIEALEKKDKLTQYDVDRANMKYDIALKQLALEEAQQNKSQMRLRRDSQGNYTYQFVSDEDQMAQAQQELAKAQNSLYNFDKERYQANLDEMLSIYTEFTERMAEASLIIDDEERLARQAMLREKYGEIINGIVADNETVKLNLQDSAFTELAGIYNVNTENYKNMTQEQKDLVMSDLIPAWQEGAQAMVDAFSGPGGFEETVSSTFDELDLATQDYIEGLDAIGEAAGVNFDQVIDGIDETIDTMDGIIDGNEDIIEQYDEQLDQMENILDLLDDMISKYQKVKNEAIAASQASYAYQQAEAKKQAEKAAKAAATASSTSRNTSSTSSSGSSNSTSSGTSRGSNGNGSNNSKNGSYNSGKKSDIYTYVGKSKAMVFDEKEDKLVSYVGAVKKRLPFTTYKTGGYTGEWAGGSEEKNGKLAMLHQKELVLNEQDTSNVLTAIQILRGMSGVLETMTGRLASLDGGFSMSTGSMGEIIQEIIINAEFPDATDRTEIQAAFENLIGRASQYAFNTEK